MICSPENRQRALRSGAITIILSAIIFLCGCGNGKLKIKMENGKKVYQLYCQTCHMENGGGVPNMNAPLIGSKYIAGDKDKLINIVLHGSAALTNEPHRNYQNKMPSLANLSDEQISDVLTYVRNDFTNKAPAVEAEEVKTARGIQH